MTSTETGLGIEAKSDAIYELVEEGSKVERLATGFTFTEGPIWHPKEQYLLFSDMPGDVRRKYTPADGTVVEVRNFSNKCNGMTYDADLNLLVCEHVTSSLVKESPDGTREIIAQRVRGRGAEQPERRLRPLVRRDLLLRPVVRAHARLRATAQAAARLPGRLPHRARWRRSRADRRPRRVRDAERDLLQRRTRRCFYINDTPGAYIKVYDAAPDGSISNGRMFFEGVGSGVIEEGIPDGMKCDERGNIWVTGPGGIWVISAAGEHLGTILVPENTGNLTWGGEDWHTVYIPSSTSLYSIRTIVGPRREPYMG